MFNPVPEPDTRAWNAFLKTHVDFDRSHEAMVCYKRMRQMGVAHDGYTFPIINRAALSLDYGILYGQLVHCVALKMGFGSELYFCNTMIEVYGKGGCIGLARRMFDEMSERDLVSWTSMISVYVSGGLLEYAFGLFEKMRMVKVEPNSVTLIVLLQGCSASGGFIEGRQVHAHVAKNGLLTDGSVQNCVLRMYAKAGSVDKVEIFFGEINQRGVVSWNTLIAFYSSYGDIVRAVDGFKKMLYEVAVSVETLSLVVSAFAKIGDCTGGRNLHSFAIKSGLCDDVLQTSLLDFYAKCGDLASLTRLFNDIPCRNSIHWSAMMSGFVQNGYFREAVSLFRQLQDSGFELLAGILRSLIDAYANLGALQLGKSVHAYLIKRLFDAKDGLRMETSILNMYIKCGNISIARECFNRTLIKDVVTWTSMIEGYATHGLAEQALKLFDQMVVKEGVKPNSVTFLSLLTACSHSGLVSEGCQIFSSMKWRNGIEPELDHYTCLVDLLARSGNLKEAITITIKMVVGHDSRIWRAILSASRIYGERRLGEFAARRLLELEPDNVGCYVLLSNVEASTEQWNKVEQVWREMNEKDLRKKPAWSFVEAQGGIHGFVSGDKPHSRL